MKIQIDNNEQFEPDEIMTETGVRIGTTEATKPEDKVRHFEPTSWVVVLHYKHKGLEYHNFYRCSEWRISFDGSPLLCGSGICEVNK